MPSPARSPSMRRLGRPNPTTPRRRCAKNLAIEKIHLYWTVVGVGRSAKSLFQRGQVMVVAVARISGGVDVWVSARLR